MNRFAHVLSMIVALVVLALAQHAQAVTIPTVPIGNPANPADTRYGSNGFGSVTYAFRMGKTEVTNAQYVEFLNAVAASDPYELYHPLLGSDFDGGIVRSGEPGSFTYSVKTPLLGDARTFDAKPVNYVNWFDAIRFANWLHNGQGGPGTTEDGAYTLLGATPIPSNADSIARKRGARWFLPNDDEWYKAAYYDGVAGVYYDYPTGSNLVPDNNFPENDTGNSANYYRFEGSTDSGAYTLSSSPYGTLDQGGNVWEWTETYFFGWKDPNRGVAGGSFATDATFMLASGWQLRGYPTTELEHIGFRVATIPEPGTILIIGLGALSALVIRRRSRGVLWVVATAIASVTVAPANALTAPIRTVALTGQPAPGTTSGVSFSAFDPPQINDAGQTAFVAALTGGGVNITNHVGIWSEGSGSLKRVIRLGDQAAGTPVGVKYGLMSRWILNDAGQIAFSARLTGSGVDSTNMFGIWMASSGNSTLIARTGDQAPGMPSGVLFYDFGTGAEATPILLALNNSGQTAFQAATTITRGIWSEGTGSLTLVAGTGSQAPGTPPGVKYSGFVLARPMLNDAGQTAFRATLTGSLDPAHNSGIWSEGSGTLALVARSGSQAPGAPIGVSFKTFSDSPVLNNAGQTAFRATLTNDSLGIWREGSGTLALVAASGNQAPGVSDGVNYGSIPFAPVLNDAGQSAFYATLSGVGVNFTNHEGIWSEGSGSLTLVVRTGSQAPGTPSGVNFSRLNLTFPHLNDGGQTAFLASLIGNGVNDSNDTGIWATDGTGVLRLIARKGDLLEVRPDDFRTIHRLGLHGSTSIFGERPSAFNNLGQLAFTASFTDGSEGVFVSNAVAHLSADFNNDGVVNAADYVLWRKSGGSQAEYNTWRANFGAMASGATAVALSQTGASVPEPASGLLLLLAAIGVWRHRRDFTAVHGSKTRGQSEYV